MATVTIADLYANLPAGLRNDLEASCLGQPYTPALYGQLAPVALAYSVRNVPATLALRFLARGFPAMDPLLVTLRALENIPLMRWPNVVRHCYAQANMVEAASLQLMLPNRDFVLAFRVLMLIWSSRGTPADQPSGGVFAPDAVETVEAATEADLDFTC